MFGAPDATRVMSPLTEQETKRRTDVSAESYGAHGALRSSAFLTMPAYDSGLSVPAQRVKEWNEDCLRHSLLARASSLQLKNNVVLLRSCDTKCDAISIPKAATDLSYRVGEAAPTPSVPADRSVDLEPF